MATYSPAQFITLVQTLTATVQSLQYQLAWFQRPMFGTRSEKLRVLENARPPCRLRIRTHSTVMEATLRSNPLRSDLHAPN